MALFVAGVVPMDKKQGLQYDWRGIAGPEVRWKHVNGVSGVIWAGNNLAVFVVCETYVLAIICKLCAQTARQRHLLCTKALNPFEGLSQAAVSRFHRMRSINSSRT